MKESIRILALASLLLLCHVLCCAHSRSDSHVEVTMRKIGHQVLLQAGDSTSRVLPISMEGERYKIEFDTRFGFLPDQLVAIVCDLVSEAEIASGYVVEVEDCDTRDVVYSFEVENLDEKNDVSCLQRAQPEGCYNLHITLFQDQEVLATLTDSSDQAEAAINQMNYLFFALLVILTAGLSVAMWKMRAGVPVDPNLISLGEYQFDTLNTELIIQNQRIELSSKEADLLMVLYNTLNRTVEREVILNRVWGDEGVYEGRTLDVFISKLRKKLDADSNVKIVNIRGVGYKLVANGRV